MLMIFRTIVIIIQHLLLSIYYKNKEKNMKKENYEYLLDDKKQDLTIYKGGNLESKKIIFVFSGAYRLTFDTYIQKAVNDLLLKKWINENYQIIVVEKLDNLGIMIYKDISNFIRSLNKKMEIEELIILGFSSGGVIASHVMSLMQDLKCKKTIITYDTPYHVLENVLSFEKNLFLRIDFYFYYIVYKSYLNYYNYENIKEFVKYDKWNYGASELIEMIKKIHKIDYEELHNISGFNFHQDKNTNLKNIYCKYDSIVNSEICKKYIKKNINNLKMKNFIIYGIGHCSNIQIDEIYNYIYLNSSSNNIYERCY
jgi:hypothetical protein